MDATAFKQNLSQLLQKSDAHADLDSALNGLDGQSRGIKLPHLPYTIWQLVEHLRIAQQNILDFCKNENYKPLAWPEEYWPKETAPENEQQWTETLNGIRKSLADFTGLVTAESSDLLKPFAHGNGQNLLREAILVIDHLSYHTGQIILIRRLLDNWEA